MFRVRGLTKIYGDGSLKICALNGVDRDLFPSELVGLLSVQKQEIDILQYLGGLDSPSGGALDFRGRSLIEATESAHVLSADVVGFVFQ